jgi:acetyltransferase-like isoleucine patch superfamily enzyme
VLTIRHGDPLAEQFASFGPGSRIMAPWVLLHNPGGVAIGSNVEIRTRLCIEALAPPGEVVLEIGDGTIIGHGTRFVATNGIVIEPMCGIGHGVTIGDSTHDWEKAEPGAPPWETPLILGPPLRIERGAWIGNLSTLVGGITIGARSIIAPSSVVTRDVPPDTMVSGNPARRVPYPRPGEEDGRAPESAPE